ncbi:MAG: cytochrome c oxidase subunit II [Leptospirales bacterium]|nr:cytochrome c oxidase subunit II [Leptospirales bacterium]
MNIINAVTIVCFVLTNAVLIYFVIRYRKRSDKDQTSSIAHSTWIEVTWTIIPTIVFFTLFAIGLVGFRQMRAAAAGIREINVYGTQWSWDFYYPANLRTDKTKTSQLKSPTNELYLEDGVPVKFIIKATDVLHSFFVPAFRVKEDAVPNMYTYMTLTPQISEEQKKNGFGVYDIFCAEYCGRDHSRMLGKVTILPSAAFKAKMLELEKEESNVSPAVGAKIYESNCKSCHSIDGSKIVGPSFKGLWGKNEAIESGESIARDENYVRESILQPGAKIAKGYQNLMPPQTLTDSQISSMIEYLKTLK